MVRLYQDPEGKHIFTQEGPTGNVVPLSTVFAQDAGGRGDNNREQEERPPGRSDKGQEEQPPGRNEGPAIATVYTYNYTYICWHS